MVRRTLPCIVRTSNLSEREIIRGKCHPVIFFIFNATFISFIQSILLFLLAAPTYIILLASKIEPNVGTADLLFAGTQLALILSEWFSDQQQWGALLEQTNMVVEE